MQKCIRLNERNFLKCLVLSFGTELAVRYAEKVSLTNLKGDQLKGRRRKENNKLLNFDEVRGIE